MEVHLSDKLSWYVTNVPPGTFPLVRY